MHNKNLLLNLTSIQVSQNVKTSGVVDIQQTNMAVIVCFIFQ